jgi:hypothetical protein
MKSLHWTKRIGIGATVAAASLFVVPGVAAADTTCYTGCTPPTVSPTSTLPAPPHTDPVHTTAVNGSSSLPFTGADVGELAAVGVGAIVVGGLLARRRRTAS